MYSALKDNVLANFIKWNHSIIEEYTNEMYHSINDNAMIGIVSGDVVFHVNDDEVFNKHVDCIKYVLQHECFNGFDFSVEINENYITVTYAYKFEHKHN